MILALLLAATAPAKEVSIVYVSSRHGAVAPCHCDQAPLGGVDRQASAITELRKTIKNLVVIDGGDDFFGDTVGEDAMKRAELIADAQLEIKPDLMVPGQRDFAKGATALRELGMRAHANWVVSNVTPPKDRPPMFLPFQAVKTPDVRVVVLALYGKNVFPQALKDEKFTVEDPVQAGKRLVAMYRNYADVIVVVAHTDAQTEEKLAEELEGVSILLSAHEGRLQFGTRKAGDTHIVSAGNQGKYLVRLDLRFRETLPKLEAGLEVQKFFRDNKMRPAELNKGLGLKDTLLFQLLPMGADIVGVAALRERAAAIDPVGYSK